MVKLAQIKPGMRAYDLGSGNGKLLMLSARRGAFSIGYEINPFLVIFTKIRVFFTPNRNNISVYWKNFWQADISHADVVFVYLLPWKMERLKILLTNQLKSGALVVSNSFIFPDWKILRQDKDVHVYVFQIS